MQQLSLSFQQQRKVKTLGGSGILNKKDLNDLSASVCRVLNLMHDGEWHDAEEIKLVAGDGVIPASEGLRRMRELRQWFTIERQRYGDGRLFQYRLKLNENEREVAA